MQRRSARLPFLFSVMFFYHIAAYMVHPVTPSLIQALGLGDYMFGVMFAAMSICSFLFSPFWGKINNYISSRTSLFLCCMGYAVGQVFFRFARAEWQFIAARLFAGVFCGGSLVCFLTYIVNVSEPEKRGRNLAINATMLTVAGAFGYFIGGMLGEIDIYLPVDGQIALLVLTGVAFRFGLADDRPAKTAVPPARELAAECNPFALFAHAGQLLSPQLIVLVLCCTFACLGCTAFDQSFNYYIRDQFGLSSKYNGSIKAILGVIVALLVIIIALNFLYVGGQDTIVSKMHDVFGDTSAFKLLFFGYDVRQNIAPEATEVPLIELTPEPTVEVEATPEPTAEVEIPNLSAATSEPLTLDGADAGLPDNAEASLPDAAPTADADAASIG